VEAPGSNPGIPTRTVAHRIGEDGMLRGLAQLIFFADDIERDVSPEPR
jgi:hypothetical protein